MNYCYIIHEREFIKTGELIFKVGRTAQPKDKRLSQYPKGSIEKIKKHVSDCVKCEREIKKVFDKKFKNRSDIGREYYEGDCVEMEKEFLKITDIFVASAKTNTINKSKKKGYYCDPCDYFTMQKYNMTVHTKTATHCKSSEGKKGKLISEKYRCDKCHHIFSTKYTLERHEDQNCESTKSFKKVPYVKKLEDELVKCNTELIECKQQLHKYVDGMQNIATKCADTTQNAVELNKILVTKFTDTDTKTKENVKSYSDEECDGDSDTVTVSDSDAKKVIKI